MSIRLEMLQVARLAPKLLGQEARDLVVDFLRTQLHLSGGFIDRSGNADLYYTVFGLESLIALRADLPTSIKSYLSGFRDGDGLDFVHLACLARCCADAGIQAPGAEKVRERIESFRSKDGGYNASAGAETGTAYHSFLALGAYQDLKAEMPDPEGLLRCLESLRADDGGYANAAEMPMGLTPPTAAAVTLLRQFHRPVPREVSTWLLSCVSEQGGFFATPMAPIPDLLSTATALHALVSMDADVEKIKEPCIDFIDTLWTSKGAFYGSWQDDVADVEYTYYALLALGHLSL